MITSRLYTDVCSIIEHGQQQAYAAVNSSMIETYWNIGKRIVEEEQQGKERAEYGERIIAKLSEQLTFRFGKGYSQRYLACFRLFYLKINDLEILQTRLQNLTDYEVRTIWNQDESMWYLAIVDVVGAITHSEGPRKYWSVLKTRLKKQGNELATNCSQLKLNGQTYGPLDRRYYKPRAFHERY